VVVVVAACVVLLLTVLTVGVVRLRAAHKRAAEEEVEMAWDDTALNITVNPMEVSCWSAGWVWQGRVKSMEQWSKLIETCGIFTASAWKEMRKLIGIPS
jgi:hypothetical protein